MPPPPAHLLWVLVGGRWGGETKGARARRSRDLNPVGHGTGTWPAPFHTQTDNQHKEEWRHTQHTRHAAMDSPKRLILARDFYEPYLQSDPLSAESITLIWLKMNRITFEILVEYFIEFVRFVMEFICCSKLMKISFAFFPFCFSFESCVANWPCRPGPAHQRCRPFHPTEHFSLYGRREREVRTTQKNENI